MLQYVVLFIAVIWLLAVYKVFILDDGSMDLPQRKSAISNLGSEIRQTSVQPPIKPSSSSKDKSSNFPSRKFQYDAEVRAKSIRTSSDSAYGLLPLSSEWNAIHFREKSPSVAESESHSTTSAIKLSVSKTDNFQDSVRADKSGNLDGRPDIGLGKNKYILFKTDKNLVKPAEWVEGQEREVTDHLQWPPVLLDGSIPEKDGYDVMPIIDLKVPKFWIPSKDKDWNKVGSKVKGEETIFLMIASYRDFQCRETITSAFSRADHPERLFIGAVDQTVPGDIGCLDIEVPCSANPNQPICKYRDQISIYHMDAQFATGPVTARHVGDRMYRGQYFVMQMDAHCQFVRHWDTQIINQWKSTGNEMAVLSSYLTDVQGSFTAQGDSTRNTRPIMCNSDFEGMMPARYLRHGSQPESMAAIRDMPQLQPFWAAGFSFSRGHFKLRVPYDAYQPMVFQGEEIAIGIRGFTHGYDFYAPRDSVVFHEYAEMSSRRKKVHMFWENTGHAGEGQKSLKRATAIIGMAPDLDPTSWDHREQDRYGLGTVRPLPLFYKLFMIDPKARKSVQLCPFVESGLMHKDFQPHLRPDGLGINYEELTDYDTMKRLKTKISSKLQTLEQNLRVALTSTKKSELTEAITNAERAGVGILNPGLLNQAHDVLKNFQ